MCEARGRFLYEAIPNILPYDYLTDLEIEIWNIKAKEKQALG